MNRKFKTANDRLWNLLVRELRLEGRAIRKLSVHLAYDDVATVEITELVADPQTEEKPIAVEWINTIGSQMVRLEPGGTPNPD